MAWRGSGTVPGGAQPEPLFGGGPAGGRSGRRGEAAPRARISTRGRGAWWPSTPRWSWEIAAGVLLGLSLPGAVWPTGFTTVFSTAVIGQVGALAQIDVVLFVLTAGLELSPRRLRGPRTGGWTPGRA